jgi:hypothetical protein
MRTIGLLSDHPPDQIPASHRDLAQCPPVAARHRHTQTPKIKIDFAARR